MKQYMRTTQACSTVPAYTLITKDERPLLLNIPSSSSSNTAPNYLLKDIHPFPSQRSPDSNHLSTNSPHPLKPSPIAYSSHTNNLHPF